MFESIVLGLIQGVTEFLPISSSGHLVLSQYLFGFRELDPAFSVFVQGGTVISVLLYFGRRLIFLTRKYFLALVLATLPAGVAGLLLGDYIDALFTSLPGVAVGFFLTTLLVWSTRYVRPSVATLTPKSAAVIGIAQMFAILPGLSRSGTTITAGLLTRITPSEAFDFSFLLSIPVIAGASLLSTRQLVWNPQLTTIYLVGFVVATLTGYFSLVVLSRMMRQGKFYVFAPYTLCLSVLSLLLAISR